MINFKDDTDQYRCGAGALILNGDSKLIFVGRRIYVKSLSGEFTFPQGGVDQKDKDIDSTMYREVEEETGIKKDKLIILDKIDSWIYYDLPKEFINTVANGMYKGQKHIWFLTKFLGTDDEIDIATENEFSEYKWMKFEDVLNQVVDFRQKVYQEVFTRFKQYLV